MEKTVSTRVADQTYQRIEDYADAHGMTRSEAVRHLLRDGLDAGRVPGAHASYGALLAVLGLIFASAQYADASGLVGPIGVVAVVAGVGYDLLHRFDFL
jgi:hypothetical protein